MNGNYYLNSNANEHLTHPPFFVLPLYSHPQLHYFSEMNPNGWNGQVYPGAWNSHEEVMGFERIEPTVNKTSAAGHWGLTAPESSSSWITPINIKVYSPPNEQNGNSMLPIDHHDWESQEQPLNWPQFPGYPGLASQGKFSTWLKPINHAGMFGQEQSQGSAPAANQTGFSPLKKQSPFTQPIHLAEMFAQGYPASPALAAGHAGFNSQKPPFASTQPVHYNSHGNPAAVLPFSANPFGFNPNGQQGSWGNFGNPAGWGGQGGPMGWGYGGNGQPGIFGSLLKLGKGTMNGIGIISSLLGIGKFLY